MGRHFTPGRMAQQIHMCPATEKGVSRRTEPPPSYVLREYTTEQKGLVGRGIYRGYIGFDKIAAQSWTGKGVTLLTVGI